MTTMFQTIKSCVDAQVEREGSSYLLLKPRTLEQAKRDIAELDARIERSIREAEEKRWQELCDRTRNPYAPYGSEE